MISKIYKHYPQRMALNFINLLTGWSTYFNFKSYNADKAVNTAKKWSIRIYGLFF
jgi:hypothetical protein